MDVLYRRLLSSPYRERSDRRVYSIHAAASYIGQAAIQIAQRANANVFVTVDNEDNRRPLTEKYEIAAEHIFSSKTKAFAKSVRNAHSAGVNIILNSLQGEGLRASGSCIAPFGRSNSAREPWRLKQCLRYLIVLKNVMVSRVDLVQIMAESNSLMVSITKAVGTLVSETGLLVSAPQPLRIFGVLQTEATFRLLQSNTECGKIVVEMREKAYLNFGCFMRNLISLHIVSEYHREAARRQ